MLLFALVDVVTWCDWWFRLCGFVVLPGGLWVGVWFWFLGLFYSCLLIGWLVLFRLLFCVAFVAVGLLMCFF